MLAVVLILMSFRFCPFFVSSQYVDRAQQNVQRKNTINHVIGRAIGLCFHSVEANRGEQLLANFALIKPVRMRLLVFVICCISVGSYG